MSLVAPPRPEPAGRPRPAARSSSCADAWSTSALPPFVRARRFLEHAGTLSARNWADVMRHAATLDPATRRAAMQHMGELLETHTRRRTCDALLRVAQDAVDAAREHGQLGAHVAARAATLASGAAFALVLRDRMPTLDFDALYAPFGSAMAPCTRTVCDA